MYNIHVYIYFLSMLMRESEAVYSSRSEYHLPFNHPLFLTPEITDQFSTDRAIL